MISSVPQTQLRIPRNLEPPTRIMLWPIHIRRDQEALILREGLDCPMAIQRDGAIDEAIGDGGAARQKSRPALILTISGFNPCSTREPISCPAFNGPRIPANSVAQHKALVGV